MSHVMGEANLLKGLLKPTWASFMIQTRQKFEKRQVFFLHQGSGSLLVTQEQLMGLYNAQEYRRAFELVEKDRYLCCKLCYQGIAKVEKGKT